MKKENKKKSFWKTLKKIKQTQLMLFFLQRFSVHKVAVLVLTHIKTGTFPSFSDFNFNAW